MATTWPCPSCGRRVPATLPSCRCGTPRPSEAAALRIAGRREKLPRDVVALLVLFVVMVVAGLVALFLPYRPNSMPAILGVMDPPRRPPSPRSPSPVPTPAHP